jgi:hypothetical protein
MRFFQSWGAKAAVTFLKIQRAAPVAAPSHARQFLTSAETPLAIASARHGLEDVADRAHSVIPRNLNFVLTPHSIVCSGEDPVQICCRADERQMRKCLRKISKMSAIQSKFL